MATSRGNPVSYTTLSTQRNPENSQRLDKAPPPASSPSFSTGARGDSSAVQGPCWWHQAENQKGPSNGRLPWLRGLADTTVLHDLAKSCIHHLKVFLLFFFKKKKKKTWPCHPSWRISNSLNKDWTHALGNKVLTTGPPGNSPKFSF